MHARRLLLAASILGAATAQAQLLVPSDLIDNDRFGATSSLSCNNAIFNAPDKVENEFGNFEIASLANQGDHWDVTFDGTYTLLTVPEPATYALILGGLTLFGAILRKRFKA